MREAYKYSDSAPKSLVLMHERLVEREVKNRDQLEQLYRLVSRKHEPTMKRVWPPLVKRVKPVGSETAGLNDAELDEWKLSMAGMVLWDSLSSALNPPPSHARKTPKN